MFRYLFNGPQRYILFKFNYFLKYSCQIHSDLQLWEKIIVPSDSDIYLIVLKDTRHIKFIIFQSILIEDIFIYKYGKNQSSEWFRYLFNGPQRYISYNIDILKKHSDKRHFVKELWEKITVPSGSDIYLMVLKDTCHIKFIIF